MKEFLLTRLIFMSTEKSHGLDDVIKVEDLSLPPSLRQEVAAS